MARIARVVITDLAHHVTQRGDGRQFILADDAVRMVCLDLLRQVVRAQQGAGADSMLVGVCVRPKEQTRRPQTLKGKSAPAAVQWDARVWCGNHFVKLLRVFL